MDYSALLIAIPVIILAATIIATVIHFGHDATPKLIVTIVVILTLLGGVLMPVLNPETAEDDGVDIFIVAGQSNAAYGYYDANLTAPIVSDDIAYYYGTAEKPLFYGGHDYPSYDTSFESYSIIPATSTLAHFEGPFSEIYHQLTGRKVITINVAVNGSNLLEWQTGEFVNTYAKSALADAFSKIPSDLEISHIGLIWIQGESNGSTPVDDYVDMWLTMYADIFEPLGVGDAFISLTRSYGPVGYMNNKHLPQEAQKKLASDYSFVHLATEIANSFYVTEGTMNTDNVHYTQIGHNQLGAALAKYCASYYA